MKSVVNDPITPRAFIVHEDGSGAEILEERALELSREIR